MLFQIEDKGDYCLLIITDTPEQTHIRALDAQLNVVLGTKRWKKLIFNLLRVKSLSSLYIGRLIRIFRYLDSEDREMIIKGVSDNLFRVFRQMYLDRIFTIQR